RQGSGRRAARRESDLERGGAPGADAITTYDGGASDGEQQDGCPADPGQGEGGGPHLADGARGQARLRRLRDRGAEGRRGDIGRRSDKARLGNRLSGGDE